MEELLTGVKLQIMMQNLRPQICDPRLSDQYQVPIQPEGGGNVVGMAYGSHGHGELSRQECLLWANLFATAPELLEALEGIMRTYVAGNLCPFGVYADHHCECNYHAAAKQARAAISKAKRGNQ